MSIPEVKSIRKRGHFRYPQKKMPHARAPGLTHQKCVFVLHLRFENECENVEISRKCHFNEFLFTFPLSKMTFLTSQHGFPHMRYFFFGVSRDPIGCPRAQGGPWARRDVQVLFFKSFF